jgi:outer membrane protein TolC
MALQIEQAKNELDETFFQIGSSQKSVDQAKENLKVTKSNYKSGISAMSDLLEAQAAYQEAVNNLTEAQCNYQIKQAKYLFTINKYE